MHDSIKQTFPGRVHIGNVHSNDKDGPSSYINIAVSDEASGVQVLSIDLSREEYGTLVGTLSEVKASVDITTLTHRIGQTREHKKELVSTGEHYPNSPEGLERLKAGIAALEVDGWIAGNYDNGANFHSIRTTQPDHGDSEHAKAKPTHTYAVGFTRWVDPETGEPTT